MWIRQTVLAGLAAMALLMVTAVQAQQISRVAAAAQLRFVLEAIAMQYRELYPENRIEVQYGSSGRFYAQITHGAPFDVFLSADMDYPAALVEAGFAATEVMPYAIGRIAIWSNTVDAQSLALADLADERFRRVAIANPRLAPYVQSGAAEVGIVALAQVLNPGIAAQGGHALIDAGAHQPLEQGLVVTRRAAHNEVARHFADYLRRSEAATLFQSYGYDLPADVP